MAASRKINIVLVIFYTLTIVLFAYAFLKNEPDSEKQAVSELLPDPSIDEFGIDLDRFEKSTLTIKPNETLSSILLNSGIPGNFLNDLISLASEVFDIRRIRAGNDYHILTDIHDPSSVCYFIYEPDPVNYIVFDLNDSLQVYSAQREVTTIEKTISGVINNTLYHSLLDNEAEIDLAVRLSNVFAWQIDFYRIQRGDKYKVIYEEDFVGEKSVGIKRIIGAYFSHYGEDYYAIRFDEEAPNTFFDLEGKSLRKAFLKAPLEFTRISSRYSKRRLHPVQKVYKPHLGTDYAAPTGTPIRTIGDGVVTEAGYSSGNGNYVKIRHNETYTTQYLHMSRFAKGIRRGTKVNQGDVIGYVGSTGLATGPHLCFRFWKNGVQVDHLREKMPPSEPVSENNFQGFIKVRDEISERLNQIPLPTEISAETESAENL